MAGELQATYTTGSTLYAILRNGAGAVYNGSTFDTTPTDGEWTTYAITMTEDATTGLYRGTMPAVTAGGYGYDVRLRAGGSAASTDRVIAQGGVEWDGSAVVVQTGDSFARIGAAGAGLTAVGDTAGTTTLLSRLTSARAGYLDNLSAGAVALQSTLSTVSTNVSTLITNVAAVAAGVWAYATRTLTQGAASAAAAVTGDSVTVYRGTRWSVTLTGLPTNTGYTSIMFSVKRDPEDVDADAILLARTTIGLVYFAGAPSITAGHASVTAPSSTSVTLTVEGGTTVYAEPGIYTYGVKYLDASGYPQQASIGGTFVVAGDMPRAVT